MKGRFAYVVLSVLATAWSVVNACGLHEHRVPLAQKLIHAISPSANLSRTQAIAKKFSTASSRGRRGSDSGREDKIQIRHTTATINASVVPASQSILALIAVLHHFVKDDHATSANAPPQLPHRRILFEAIISPNAP